MESEEERLATPRLGTVRGDARLELSDLRAAIWAGPAYRLLGFLVVYLAFIGIPQVLWVVSTGTVPDVSWWFLAATAVMLAAFIAVARQPHRTLARMSREQRDLTYEIDERGYGTRNGADESTRVAWSSVSEVIVRPAHLFLVTGAVLLPIPRRAFAPHDFDRAVEIARRSVPVAVHRAPWRARGGVMTFVAAFALVLVYCVYRIATGVPQERIPCGVELVVRRTSATTFEADVAFRNDGAEDAVGWVPGLEIVAYHADSDPVVVVPRSSERLLHVPAGGRSITITEPLAVDASGRWRIVATYDDSYFDGRARDTPMCVGFAESAEVAADVDVE